MRAIWVILAIAVALALQTTLARFVIGGTAALDLVLVVVVYVALTSGAVTGLFAGTVAGFVQDTMSSGVIGIGGLAKTVVGFLAGVVGTQFIVAAPFPRALVFMAATLVHAAVFMGLYVLLDLRHFPSPWTAMLGQGVTNAIVGVIGFWILESLPGAMERRRVRRRR